MDTRKIMSKEFTHTRLESLLQREISIRKGRNINIHGCTSTTALAYFLANTFESEINSFAHLVVVPNTKELLRLQQAIWFFDPDRSVSALQEFDANPYSSLYPSPKNIHAKLNFLFSAFHAKPGQIFLCTPMSLAQPCMEFSYFSQNTFSLKAGSEVDETFYEWLNKNGYSAQSLVEDPGQFSRRGGILDIFSPAHNYPVRIEFFGDNVESLRTFSTSNQTSIGPIEHLNLIPAQECLFPDTTYEKIIANVRASIEDRPVPIHEKEEFLRSIVLRNHVPGIEFLVGEFYNKACYPGEYFSIPLNIWHLDKNEVVRSYDQYLSEIKSDYKLSSEYAIRPNLKYYDIDFSKISLPPDSRSINLSALETTPFLSNESDTDEEFSLGYPTFSLSDLQNSLASLPVSSDAWLVLLKDKLKKLKESGLRIIFSAKNSVAAKRLDSIFQKIELHSIITSADDCSVDIWLTHQDSDPNLVHIVPRVLPESVRILEERLALITDSDILGKRTSGSRTHHAYEDFQKQAKRLSFGELKPGDYIVHIKHGIGQYDGLRLMDVAGITSEFIQISYKDKDRLFLPIYQVGQIQKHSDANTVKSLDKLGGARWEKVKSKVKSHLRDLASDLLELYAKRADTHRPPFLFDEQKVLDFEKGFPYEETDDQLRAISDVRSDLTRTQPMDRLVCGDVGFGKTEVAMRAAFFAVQAGKQVALLAPTTVLTFQHGETLRKRFAHWPINIRVLNRFVDNAEAKKILNELADGKVDILIGTHRILSKDVQFKNLGLLIVDEEQRFGVLHKEKIKKLRVSIDTLTLSATPIPRTLNMSLLGIRDLSLITTPPVDRLPTRTYVCKFDPETIRKAITAEISRGGQVYFIHNRIQSIYSLADELRQILPNVRMKVAHGQLDENQLEKTMLEFFHHEIDVLICTAIVESGMDVSRANTMFIDQAQLFGLSQLYQLRGRVGRSKERAYCYLVLPREKKLDKDAQERLKIIQENSALGSGIKIAQYDLELRGAGNLLGEDQSGHIDSVGYELYMDLLSEALQRAQGAPAQDSEIDPEINLRIPALIPENYISDVRLRLGYYKSLADIKTEEDVQSIEAEMLDQFGPLPEQTINLIGLMLIRRQCKDLGVKDISSGLKTISLQFTPTTNMKPETVIALSLRENKKYSINPDSRLSIRINNLSWSAVYEELSYLKTLC